MISVVIPVYNEDKVLDTLYQRLSAVAQDWPEGYEVILVDDGSRDQSLALLQQLHERDRRWKVLSFSRNFGHQAAVTAGIYFSRGEAVVVMDADLQDPPEELHRFLDKWREGYEVVYAIRTKRKENILKRFAYWSFYRLLQRMSSLPLPLDSGDFCVMDQKVVAVLRALPERSRFVRGLRSWAGFRQIGIPYERHARQAGEPKYTLRKLFQLAFDGMLSFSNLPLRLASWLGFGCCATALFLICLVTGWYVSDMRIAGMNPRDAVGWTSLVSLLLFTTGLQMLFIGILGEYVARIFDEVKARPPWVIQQALGIQPSAARDPIGWFAPMDESLNTAHPPRLARAG